MLQPSYACFGNAETPYRYDVRILQVIHPCNLRTCATLTRASVCCSGGWETGEGRKWGRKKKKKKKKSLISGDSQKPVSINSNVQKKKTFITKKFNMSSLFCNQQLRLGSTCPSVVFKVLAVTECSLLISSVRCLDEAHACFERKKKVSWHL